MNEPNKQATIMAVTAKPRKLRFVTWDGMPFRDRWLMIAPVIAGPHGPAIAAPSGSDIGLIALDNQFVSIRKGQICLYDEKRNINIVDNIDKIYNQYNVVGEVTA